MTQVTRTGIVGNAQPPQEAEGVADHTAADNSHRPPIDSFVGTVNFSPNTPPIVPDPKTSLEYWQDKMAESPRDATYELNDFARRSLKKITPEIVELLITSGLKVDPSYTSSTLVGIARHAPQNITSRIVELLVRLCLEQKTDLSHICRVLTAFVLNTPKGLADKAFETLKTTCLERASYSYHVCFALSDIAQNAPDEMAFRALESLMTTAMEKDLDEACRTLRHLFRTRPDLMSDDVMALLLAKPHPSLIQLSDGGLGWSSVPILIGGQISQRDEVSPAPVSLPQVDLTRSRPLSDLVPSTEGSWNGRTLRLEPDPDGSQVVFKAVAPLQTLAELAAELSWLLYVAQRDDLHSIYPRPLMLESAGIFTGAVTHESREGIVFRVPPRYYTSLEDPSLSFAEFREGLLRAAHDLMTLARNGVYHLAPIGLFHNTEMDANERPDHGKYTALPDVVFGWTGMGRLDNFPKALTFQNIGATGLRDLEELARLEDILDSHRVYLEKIELYGATDAPARYAHELANFCRMKIPNAGAHCQAALTSNMILALTLNVGLRALTEHLPSDEVKEVYEKWHGEAQKVQPPAYAAQIASQWVGELWHSQADSSWLKKMRRYFFGCSSFMSLWRNDKALQPFAELLHELNATTYAALWGIAKDDAFAPLKDRVDWLKLARQLAFFMSPAYVEYVREDARPRQLPQGIYNPQTEVKFGGFRRGTFDRRVGFVGPDGHKDKLALGPVNGQFPVREVENSFLAHTIPPARLGTLNTMMGTGVRFHFR